MSPEKEHKFLTDSLKDLERPAQSWSWSAFLLEAVAFAGLAALALWIIEHRSGIETKQIIVLFGTFVAGTVVGSIGLWRSLCHKGALIRPYIDQAKIRARLAELEA